MKFKVGDKVRCISNTERQSIKINEIYTVEKVVQKETMDYLFFNINGKECNYRAERFELAEEKKKAEVLTKQEIYSNVGTVDNTVTPIKAIVNGIATILFYYSSFDYIPIERKIVAKCQEGDKFTKEDGLRICVLKAMKRELERELKQY